MTVLWLDRANPNLKDLQVPPQVWIGLKLKHPARKIFDVGVIAVIQAARFAQTLIQITVAGTVLAEIRCNYGQRRPVFISPSHTNRKPKRDGCRTRLTLDDLNLRSGIEFRLG